VKEGGRDDIEKNDGKRKAVKKLAREESFFFYEKKTIF
jgi:hypothetical protein